MECEWCQIRNVRRFIFYLKLILLQKCVIFAVVVGVCIAATVTIDKPEEKKPEVVDDLKTAETRGRQFGHGGKSLHYDLIFHLLFIIDIKFQN